VFTRLQVPGEEAGTEAGIWSPWQPPVVVAIVAGVSASLFVILCVAVVVCKRCVDRTPTRATFERSVTARLKMTDQEIVVVG